MASGDFPGIDIAIRSADIAAHHKECHGCRSLYVAARQLDESSPAPLGTPSAMEVWRREFWRCWTRTVSGHKPS